MVNVDKIFEKAYLEESSDMAREYFKQCDLKVEEIILKHADILKNFITKEIDILLADKEYSMIPKLKMNKKIKVDEFGIFLFTDGYYFKKRQAISIEHNKRDGHKFIGFCGWASGCNRIPYIKGFIKWCDWVCSEKRGLKK